MHVEFNYKSQRRLCWTASSAIYTIQVEHNCAQQCLIQSDVEQPLEAPSVHSFVLVYLISSQLLLKAIDLDWVQINSFTTEAVDNIHLFKHVPLKASTKSLIKQQQYWVLPGTTREYYRYSGEYYLDTT